MQFRNGIFIVTEEDHCPLYNAGEELKVYEGILSLPASKPTCLTLAKEVIAIASADASYENYTAGGTQKSKFECGGCTGLIRFEYKKEKGYATTQMKLLAAAERKEKIQGILQFAGILRQIEIFSPLSDDDLLDLATLLEQADYPWQFPIVQKGDPGNKLYILLAGRADVIDEEGVTIAELKRGDVFGEMSLLTGERVTSTIVAAEPSQVAMMNQKNFRHILTKFPALQVFFYKLLVNRITKMNRQRADELASGMVGQLSDISLVEVCQMINVNQKTGRLNIEFENSKAALLFSEGELVKAEYGSLLGKEAFYEVLALKQGRFNFHQGLTEKQRRLDVIGGFMGMIMEGMKRLDETRS